MTKILGIDPGYERLGIAVIDTSTRKATLLFSECFTTPKSYAHHDRLRLIADHLNEVIQTYKPEQASIETLFFSTNKKTALAVAEARGAILLTCSHLGLIIREFLPAHIKVAIAGHGRADKKQMMAMVPRLVEITKHIETDDEFDAIAIALTAAATRLPLSPQK